MGALDMLKALAAYGAGLLFGLGLAIAQMTNPAKVLNFLDVTGQWDPSLAFVMGGALLVTALGYRFVFKRRAPLLAEAFQLPKARTIDATLLGGAALFGVGWGLVGLCPGPVLAVLATGVQDALIFGAAMLAAMAVTRVLRR